MYFLVLLSALLACAAGAPSNTAKPTQDGRVVGGIPARIEDHPHQVALLEYRSFICAGSIISPTYVVTTASCVLRTTASSLTVTAGSEYYGSGEYHYVTGGVYHGSYNEFINDFDVAVLRVDPPFSYSDRVQNIVLQESVMSPGTNVVVTGWGDTWEGGPNSYNLHEAIVEITDDYTCRANSYQFITDRMICTGHPYDFKGPCDGDGGSPLSTLYYPRKLVGITSWGSWNCGHPDYPAVYTKVSAVRDWIIYFSNAEILPNGIRKADAIP